MSDPVARTLEAACALAEWEMRGGRGRDDGSWERHVDAVIAATKGVNLDGTWFTVDSLAAALTADQRPFWKLHIFPDGSQGSWFDYRGWAAAIIKAAKEASEPDASPAGADGTATRQDGGGSRLLPLDSPKPGGTT